jgi:hypothetical protein
MAYQGYYNHGGIAGRSYANGATSEWAYDAVQRPSAMLHGLAGTGHDALWTYTRNPASQITSQTRDNDAYAWPRHQAMNRAYTTNGLNQHTAGASTTLTFGPALTALLSPPRPPTRSSALRQSPAPRRAG